MSDAITIKMEGETFSAELYDVPGAKQFYESLPLTVAMSKWGNELYGDCEMDLGLDDTAREVMEVGELAFWPPGSAFCIFFGPTPASTDEKPVAASAVLPLGKITINLDTLSMLGSGTGGKVEAVIEKA